MEYRIEFCVGSTTPPQNYVAPFITLSNIYELQLKFEY